MNAHENVTYFNSLLKQSFRNMSAHKGPVNIGNDVWIGADVTIHSSVSIGDGAVIGGQSVVRENVPPYAIVIGNPAVIVKYRHSQEVIDQLLKIKWWTWPLDKVLENVHLLMDMI
jgi:virginiamycin A acetyltransferase